MKTRYIALMVISTFVVVFFCNRSNEEEAVGIKEVISDAKPHESSDQPEKAAFITEDESVDASLERSAQKPNSNNFSETKEDKKRLRTRQSMEKAPHRDEKDITDPRGVQPNGPVFSRSIFNSIISSTSDEGEFLARNSLGNIRNWRQLSQIDTQHQDMKTLIGSYTGVIQRSERPDLLVELTIEIEENRFVGNMSIRNSKRKEFSDHPHLKGELRVVDNQDVVSVAIFATGHNPSVAFQLFFEKGNADKVAGNIYVNQRGAYERIPTWLYRKPL